jgi:hypothetical protein
VSAESSNSWRNAASECPRPEKPELEIYGSSFLYDPDIEQITPVYHVRAGKFRAEAVDISLSAQFGDIIKDEEYAQELRRSHMQGGATVNMIVQSWHCFNSGVATSVRELTELIEFKVASLVAATTCLLELLGVVHHTHALSAHSFSAAEGRTSSAIICMCIGRVHK